VSRALTEEEVRNRFLDAVASNIHYWRNIDFREVTDEDEMTRRISGAIFSTLVILDGEHGFMPGFKVIPDPHPDDKQYHIDNDENWYPEDVDIAGDLHHSLHKHE